MATFLPRDVKKLDIVLQYVVFPLHGGPMTNWPNIKLIVMDSILYHHQRAYMSMVSYDSQQQQ